VRLEDATLVLQVPAGELLLRLERLPTQDGRHGPCWWVNPADLAGAGDISL
jgi:hypothetical protein